MAAYKATLSRFNMRILHLIMSASPAYGGPIEGVRQLGRVLNCTGEHQVEVATLDDPRAPFLTEFPLPVYPLGPSRTWYGYSPRLIPWLRANAPRFDVVVLNGLWRYTSFGAWMALRRASTPYAVFTHGMLSPWFKRKYPLKHLKKWLYWPWADYRVLRDAGAVLFTCEEERVLARQSFWLYSAREVVVGYGTSRPPSPDPVELEHFLAQFPKLQSKRLALFMGRLHQVKGCDLAIESFARVLAPDPAWHLVMAGPDQVGLRAVLSNIAAKRGVSDRITWTGMLTGPAKRSAFQTTEIFLLPSHQENFGIVVAEAMSYGVPPLISDKVNIWREIREDGAGIVASDDLEGTCSSLTRWLSLSGPEKEQMKACALRTFAGRFEIHAAAGNFIRALTALQCSGPLADAAAPTATR